MRAEEIKGGLKPRPTFLLTVKQIERGGVLPLFGDMRSSSPSTPSQIRAHVGRGFTLIELLAALAIVGILTAIVLGGGGRANEVGKIAKAKAEIAALSAALETFRRQHGDYPRVDDSAMWLHSLVGERDGRSLIDLAQFTVGGGVDPRVDASARLIDPWGQPYFYFYKTGADAAWKANGFVLYSAGPNGVHVLPNPDTGFFDPLHVDNADNVYAGL